LGRLEEHAAANLVEQTGVDVRTSSDDRGVAAAKALATILLAR